MGWWLPLQVALAVPPFLYAWREGKKGHVSVMTELGYSDCSPGPYVFAQVESRNKKSQGDRWQDKFLKMTSEGMHHATN